MSKLGLVQTAALFMLSVFGSPSTSLAQDLATLNDQSAKAVALGSRFSCQPNGRMRIEALSAGFYDRRHQDLGALFGAALNSELARCPALQEMQVFGMVNGAEFVRATASAQENWILRLEPTKMDKAAASILTDVNSYRQLPKLESLFRPFREVPGISETNGYQAFAANAKAVVDALNADDTRFQSFAESYAKSRDQKKSAQFVEQVLTTVSYYDPTKADELRRLYKDIVEGRSASELSDYLASSLVPGESIANVVNNLSAQVERRKPLEGVLVSADQDIASWIESKLIQHETKYGGNSLGDVSAHLEMIRSFEGIVFSDHLPETRNSVETANFWFEALSEEILADNVFEAQGLIDHTGDGFYDVDLVLETSLLLSNEFEQSGFSSEAQIIVDYGFARIESLIESGLPDYLGELKSEPMSFERVAYLRDEMSAFIELSEDYPEFQRYVEAIEASIASGQREACQAQAKRILTEEINDIKVETGARTTSLSELTCDLYANSHLLTNFELDAATERATLTVDVDSEGVLEFELAHGGQLGTFVGVDRDWPDEIARLTIKPPFGQPDRNGVTECDVLAGDPADGTLPNAGVVLEDLPIDYDYDRAIDACIAAVEHDPNSTRQLYQLARVLDFLGDAENANQYIEAASNRGFGPAIHLKAVSALTYRDDDDAFFDAIDWFKEAAAWGYAPAMMELTELIPPGEEMFREVPPPTDQEVLNAFGPDICADEGLLVTCIFFEEVRKKACIQTSGNEFSCEIIMRFTCDIRGKGGDPVGNFFANGLRGGGGLNRECRLNPETQPLFVKMTKANGGKWSYEREF